jgi:hypothetical protein
MPIPEKTTKVSEAYLSECDAESAIVDTSVSVLTCLAMRWVVATQEHIQVA